MLIKKNSESRGNILKIKHKLDIFNEISRFLFTFQSVPHMPRHIQEVKIYKKLFLLYLFEKICLFLEDIKKGPIFAQKNINKKNYLNFFLKYISYSCSIFKVFPINLELFLLTLSYSGQNL